MDEQQLEKHTVARQQRAHASTSSVLQFLLEEAPIHKHQDQVRNPNLGLGLKLVALTASGELEVIDHP